MKTVRERIAEGKTPAGQEAMLTEFIVVFPHVSPKDAEAVEKFCREMSNRFAREGGKP